jgi:hypothetical protein
VECHPSLKKLYEEGSRSFKLELAVSARRSSLLLFDMDNVLAMTKKAQEKTPDPEVQDISTPDIDALMAETNILLQTHTPRPSGSPTPTTGEAGEVISHNIDTTEDQDSTSSTIASDSGSDSEPQLVVEVVSAEVAVVTGVAVRVSELKSNKVQSHISKSQSLSSMERPTLPAEMTSPDADSHLPNGQTEESTSRRAHRSMAVSSAVVAQIRNVVPLHFPRTADGQVAAGLKSPRATHPPAKSPRESTSSSGQSEPTPPNTPGGSLSAASSPGFIPAAILNTMKLNTIQRGDSVTRVSTSPTLAPTQPPAAEADAKPRSISIVKQVLSDKSSSSTSAESKVAPTVKKEPPQRQHRPSHNAAALRESKLNKLKLKTEQTIDLNVRHTFYDSDDDDDSEDEEEDPKKKKRDSEKRSSDKRASDKRDPKDTVKGHGRQASSTLIKSPSQSNIVVPPPASPSSQRKKKFRRAKKRTFDNEMMRRRLNYGQFRINSDNTAMERMVDLSPLDSAAPWMGAKPVVFGDRDEKLKKRAPISIQRMSLMRQSPFFELTPQDLANFRAISELKLAGESIERRAKQVIVHLSTCDKAVLIDLRLHETIKSVKERSYSLFQTHLRGTASEKLLLPMKDYMLELAESGIYLHDEEKEVLNAWVSSKKDRPEHFALTERSDAEKSKELCKEVALTLDCPALLPYWLPLDNEQSHFRKNMSRNTVIQKRSNLVIAPLSKGPLSPAFPASFTVTVFLSASASKTCPCNIHTSALDLMTEFCRKHKIEVLDPSDYMLRICGVSEFVLPDTPLVKLEYVRRCMERRKRIRFNMMPKVDPVTVFPAPTHPPDPKELGITVSHLPAHSVERPRARAARLRAAGSASALFYPSSGGNTTPQWSVKKSFELRIQRIESLQNLTGQNFPPGTTLFVEVGLYFGGELISDLKRTQTVSYSSQPVFDKILAFRSICVCNIPRETRVCCSIIAVDSKGNQIPVSWVAFNLFDYHDILKSGQYQVFMWPNDRANPIGVCGSNLSQKERGQNKLCLDFDCYSAPVAFTDVLSLPPISLPQTEPPLGSMAEDLEELLSFDPLWRPTEEEKVLLWRYRTWIRDVHPDKLAKVALCVPWTDAFQVAEMYRLLQAWPKLQPEIALELLDSRYADATIRGFAVTSLESMDDQTLLMHLLQLVQVLKYESQHYGALAQFLVDRACENERLLGIPFFWYLKAEMPTNETMERFGLILESFLIHCTPQFREEIKNQMEVLAHLKQMATTLRGVPQSKRTEVLRELLPQITFPDTFTLPLNPTQMISGSVDLRKCKCFDSAKAPLLICFKSADPVASMDDVLIMFKAGDDLRQDALTVQMLHIMDQIWKAAGLDLHLTPYRVSVTSENHGLIEVVPDSTTNARIQREAGGATAAFKMTPLANWMKTTNPSTEEYENAVDNFVLSTAGYCVATYVLGIGDRHNDNIMMDKYGHLFHIDFGHFLGNFKSWKGLIKREKAPFVLTPEFAFAMGGIDSDRFKYFCRLCCRAYNLVRRKANLLLNLFAMMLSTGIPELRSDEDLLYLQDALCQELSDEEAAELFMELIEESLNSKATELNFFFHILAH